MKANLTKLKGRIFSLILAAMAVVTTVPNTEVMAAGDYDGGYAIAYTNQTVWNSSDSSSATKIGTIYANEGFTVLSQYGNAMRVNYSTSSGAKQGYLINPNVCTSYLAKTCVAKVATSTTLYYGPNASSYDQSGSVSSGEYVAVLETNGTWSWIEYNTNSGRKRGYILNSKLQSFTKPSAMGSLCINNGSNMTVLVGGNRNILAGPSNQYPVIGTVGPSDNPITYYAVIGINGQSYKYVRYKVTSTNKYKTGFLKEQ